MATVVVWRDAMAIIPILLTALILAALGLIVFALVGLFRGVRFPDGRLLVDGPGSARLRRLVRQGCHRLAAPDLTRELNATDGPVLSSFASGVTGRSLLTVRGGTDTWRAGGFTGPNLMPDLTGLPRDAQAVLLATAVLLRRVQWQDGSRELLPALRRAVSLLSSAGTEAGGGAALAGPVTGGPVTEGPVTRGAVAALPTQFARAHLLAAARAHIALVEPELASGRSAMAALRQLLRVAPPSWPVAERSACAGALARIALDLGTSMADPVRIDEGLAAVALAAGNTSSVGQADHARLTARLWLARARLATDAVAIDRACFHAQRALLSVSTESADDLALTGSIDLVRANARRSAGGFARAAASFRRALMLAADFPGADQTALQAGLRQAMAGAANARTNGATAQAGLSPSRSPA